MALYVSSPKGEGFAASGMDSDVSPYSHIRIASNTKMFTSAAILLLAQQGKLRLDDTIVSTIPGQAAPYVPDTPQFAIPHKSQITIRQLLSHTAGVLDVTNEKVPATCPVPYADKYYQLYITDDLGETLHQFSPEELIGVVATCQPDSPIPGTQYHYTNTGFSLLAVILERTSGMAYDQFLIQNLLTPNRLNDTSVPMLATQRTLPGPLRQRICLR